MSVTTAVRTRILSGFDDAAVSRDTWNRLVDEGSTRVPYLTWEFQRAYWDSRRSGELLLIAAERDGRIVALAPLLVDHRMIWFLGSTFEYDYLDLIGDTSDPCVPLALFEAACARVDGLREIGLEFVPAASAWSDQLPALAASLGMGCELEYEMTASEIDLVAHREQALAAVNRPRVLKTERWFTRHGRLDVRHLDRGEEILPHLPEFFEQHRARWPGPENPSRFHGPQVCDLFERLTRRCANTGQLRFTRIDWDGRPIAFHYGYVHGRRFFFGSMSFDPALARLSPGALLLRHVLWATLDEHADAFDFGTGDQAFKLRLATGRSSVRSWLLEPASGVSR